MGFTFASQVDIFQCFHSLSPLWLLCSGKTVRCSRPGQLTQVERGLQNMGCSHPWASTGVFSHGQESQRELEGHKEMPRYCLFFVDWVEEQDSSSWRNGVWMTHLLFQRLLEVEFYFLSHSYNYYLLDSTSLNKEAGKFLFMTHEATFGRQYHLHTYVKAKVVSLQQKSRLP